MPTDWRKEEDERAALLRLAEVRAIPVYRSPRTLGRAIVSSLKPILKEAGPAPETLASRWAEIVGERLAKVTAPVRVSRGKAGGVLHLRAPSAAAPMIQHAAEHILERVNLASGSKVKTIRIIHTAAPSHVSAPRARSLSPAEREALVRSLALVHTPAVRSALEELGNAILTRREEA
jgi:hypothetical protein